MKLSEMIEILQGIKQTQGDLECLLTDAYSHHHVRWIDYSECRGKVGEHVCIRIDD